MKIFEKLYYNYYQFQLNIGNRDIAPFSAMLIIVFTVQLYYFAFVMLMANIFQPRNFDLNSIYFKEISLSILIFLMLFFYYNYLYRKKYKEIIKKYSDFEQTGRKKSMILFPLIGFILFNLSWIIKILQNTGKL